MDIRNFFTAKGGSKPTSKSSDQNSTKTKNEKKKRANVISDSESDEDFEKKPKVDHKKQPSPKFPKSSAKTTPKPKLKEVNASDFFNSKEAPRTIITPSKKRKSPEKISERDKCFEDTLDQTPFPNSNKKQRIESPDKQRTLASKISKAVSKTVDKSEKEAESVPDYVKDSKRQSPKDQLLKSPKATNSNISNVQEQSLNDSIIPASPQESWEAKRAAKTAAYKKYVSRGGAKNPGSKEVPEGSPNCLNGCVFVLTGIYESLEREEMSNIIKNLGGKVTTSISKNTNYLVIGEEAGESKLAKAKALGTKQISEDDLLQLIKDKTVKEKENKTPRTSPDAKKIKAEVKQKTEIKIEKKISPKKYKEEDVRRSTLSPRRVRN